MNLALGIAGGIAGSFFASAGIGFAVGSELGGMLDYLLNRPAAQQVGLLDDKRLSFSTNATPIPLVRGRMRLPGNVIWATDLIDATRHEGGGCGEGPSTDYHTYYASFAYLVCEGRASVKRIFDEKGTVIYNSGATPVSKFSVAVHEGNQTEADLTIRTVEGVDYTPAFKGLCYVVFDHMDLTDYGNRIPTLSFEVEHHDATSDGTTTGAVLSALFERAGLSSSQYDVSAATDVLTGFAMTGGNPVSEYVTPILRAFGLDLVAVNEKLVVVKRGGSSVVTIPLSDMGASSSAMKSTRYESRIAPELELPRRFDVSYYDPDLNYQQGVQSAIRHTKQDLQDAVTLNLPCAIPSGTARQIAERLLYTAWRERETITLSVLPKYGYLAPGDVITATVAGSERRLRIEEMSYSAFGEIGLTCVPDSIDVLTQSVGSDGRSIVPPSETDFVPTVFGVWSGVALKDSDVGSPCFYVVGGGASGWRGGSVLYSVDSGASWLPAGASITSASIIGASTGTLANWSSDPGWDSSHSVGVSLSVGTLEPASATEVENGYNRFLLGSELIGVSGATLSSGSNYTLSSLYRRYRSSTGTGHSNGERFLEVRNAVRVEVGSQYVGSTLLVKVVSFGADPSGVTAQSVVIGSPGALPFPGKGDGISVLATADPNRYTSMIVNDAKRGGLFVPLVTGASPDNGITFASSVSGTLWRRVFSGDYNALWFGAVGDGSTDDTAAIQNGINSASSAGGGRVKLPNGTYRVATGLTLKSNVSLMGDGAGTILLFDDYNQDGIRLSDNITTTVKTLTANVAAKSRLVTIATGTNIPAGTDVYLHESSGSNIYYTGFVTRVQSCNSSTGVVQLEDAVPVAMTTANGAVLEYGTWAKNIGLRDLTLKTTGGRATTRAMLVNVNLCRDVEISNVSVENAWQYPIRVNDSRNVRLSGCRVSLSGFDEEGITITSSTGVVVDGCFVQRCAFGIVAQHSHAVNITNCFLSGKADKEGVWTLGLKTTGTFTLSFGGQTTASLNSAVLSAGGSTNANTIKTALEGLSSVGSGNVSVVWDTAHNYDGVPYYTITFQNSLEYSVTELRASGSGLDSINPDSRRGIKLEYGTVYSSVENCTIQDHQFYAVYLSDAPYCKVIGNTIVNTGYSTSRHGIVCAGFSTAYTHHQIIQGNLLSNIGGYGIVVGASGATGVSAFTLVDGNVMEKVNDCINVAMSDITVTNNIGTNFGSGNTAIFAVAGVSNTLISGNRLWNSPSGYPSGKAIDTSNATNSYIGLNYVSGLPCYYDSSDVFVATETAGVNSNITAFSSAVAFQNTAEFQSTTQFDDVVEINMPSTNAKLKLTSETSHYGTVELNNGALGVWDASASQYLLTISASDVKFYGTGGSYFDWHRSSGQLDVDSLTLTSPLSVGYGGTGTGTAFTKGSLVFVGSSGIYSQNNASLFWDNTNARLGIGTASPSYSLHVKNSGGDITAENTSAGSGAALRLYGGNANNRIRTKSTGGSTTNLYFTDDTNSAGDYLKLAVNSSLLTMTLFDATNIVPGTTTGLKLGTSVSQKLGFFNATPIVQPSGAGQAAVTDSTGGTAGSSLSDVGATHNQSTLNNNFATLAREVDSIRTALVNLGLMKGGA